MGNVRVINISEEYQRILYFLYPEYSLVDGLYQFNKFIIKKDVTSSTERANLNYRYNDAVFISTRIFDEVWDENKIKEEVLKFAKERLGSRKRTVKTLATEGDRFIDELIMFMFTDSSIEDTDIDINELFASYGQSKFLTIYLQACDKTSVNQVSSAMETFISKVLSETDSIFYKRAKMRLEKSLRMNVKRAIEDQSYIDPLFKSKFKDLVKLRMYTVLLYNEYYNTKR